uniref:matrilin-3-like isoform X1 n=1 Tax=Styela clava TaxID=7725 RepID=UPI00193A301E|nr:matrilin-3-like isoform X1 [Styela clava]
MYTKVVISLWILATLSTGYACTTDSDILIDIIFVVDGSGSIGEANFEIVRSWLINATGEMMQKFGDRAQFGVLQYSSKDPVYYNIPIEKSTVFEIPFRLGDCKTIECMKDKLTSMDYLQAQTYTYYALRRVIEVEFSLSPRYPEAKKAIVLLTDGAANDGVFLSNAYHQTVLRNITNFVIGVGHYQLKQLKVFANGGKTNERVFTRTDFESLSTVMETLESELAKEGFFCDECAAGTDNCSPHAKCTNKANGFECKCKLGFYGDGVSCIDIDDCFPNPCKENSRCVDGINQYQCVCDQGFRSVGNLCENIDDCVSNPCGGRYPICVDTIEGYRCEREPGGDPMNPTGGDDMNNTVAILTFALAAVIIVLLTCCVIYIIRRQHVYNVRSPKTTCRSDQLLSTEKYEETASV